MADTPPAKPAPQKPDGKPERDKLYDQLVIEKTFPHPQTILRTVHPPVNEIAKDCLFALDANTLLAPFAVGKDSLADVDRVFRLLVKAGRLFIPAQGVREYARNRSRKVADIYEHLKHRLTAIENVNIGFQTPMFEALPEHKAAVEAAAALTKSANQYKDRLKALIEQVENWNCNDPVSALYAEVLTDDLIIHHTHTAEHIKEDLEYRVRHQLPPGYKDAGKADGGIGDLIIWHTLLRLGECHKRNLIFVTNDEKSDWTINANKEALFPRFELVEEYYRIAQKHFALMTFSQFLCCFGADAKTIKEVQTVDRDHPLAGIDLSFLLTDKEFAADFAEFPPELVSSLALLRENLAKTIASDGPSPGLITEDRWLLTRTLEQLRAYRAVEDLPGAVLRSIKALELDVEAVFTNDVRVRGTNSVIASNEFLAACKRLIQAIARQDIE